MTHTVVDELDLDDMRCRGERGVNRRFVTALEAVRQITRRFVPQGRCRCSERRDRVDCRRQWPVHHGDALDGIARLILRVGDDERHRVADMPNPVARQWPA